MVWLSFKRFAIQIHEVIRFFSGNNPLNLFILLFLGILLRMPYFIQPLVPQLNSSDGFLYLQLLQWMQKPGAAFTAMYPIIAYLLLFTQAVTLNSFINAHKLFPSNNFLIAFAYLLVTSLIPEWNTISPGLIINSIMVSVLPSMLSLYHNQKVKGLLFNIGFGFGICSFIYFPSVYFMLLLIIALALFRPIQITEWLVTIIGVVTPFYFLLIYFFVWDQWHRIKEIIPSHHLRLPVVQYNWQFWVTIGLVLLPAFTGFIISNRYSMRLIVQGRKSWGLMIYYLIIALFIPFINNYSGVSHFILAAIPLSIFIAAFYAFPKNKRYMDISVWLSFGWILWQYIVS